MVGQEEHEAYIRESENELASVDSIGNSYERTLVRVIVKASSRLSKSTRD